MIFDQGCTFTFRSKASLIAFQSRSSSGEYLGMSSITGVISSSSSSIGVYEGVSLATSSAFSNSMVSATSTILLVGVRTSGSLSFTGVSNKGALVGDSVCFLVTSSFTCSIYSVSAAD